jgi:hypothetical protein
LACEKDNKGGRKQREKKRARNEKKNEEGKRGEKRKKQNRGKQAHGVLFGHHVTVSEDA